MRETYSIRRRQMSVSVSQSRIESVRSKDVTWTGLRIYRDGRLGIAGAIGAFDPRRLEERASASLSPGVEYPWEPSKDFVLEREYPAAMIPDASFAEEAEAVLSELRRAQPGIIFSNSIQQDSTARVMENEAGLGLSCSTQSLSILLTFKEEKSTGIIDGEVFVADSRNYERSTALREMLEFCEAYWNRVELPRGGRLPVVYPRLGSELLFGRLPWELGGRAYGTGSSLLAGKMGQKVFGERFSLSQCNDPERSEDCFFDMEGVVNDGFRYPLVERGVLRAVQTDRRIAAKYGLAHTGSAVGGFDSVPSAGCVGLEVEGSGRNLADLLEGRPGVFVVMAAGGDYTPDGRFATPVQLAMLHDGRRFVGRLPEMRISSHLFTMFGDDFLGLSADSISELSDNRCMVTMMDVEKA